MGFSFLQTAKDYVVNPPFTSRAIAFGSDVAAASLLIAKTWNYPDTVTVVVTDSQMNTWLPATAAIVDTNTTTRMRIFYAIAGSAGPLTVTITPDASANPYGAVIEEFSGTAAITLDGGATGTGSGTNPGINITTASNNELVVAQTVTTGGAVTEGAGYTIVAANNSLWYEGAEYNLDAGSAGAFAVAFVSGSGDWAVAAAAFKLASAPAVTTGIGRAR